MQIKRIVFSALACAITAQAATQYPAHAELAERLDLLDALLAPVVGLLGAIAEPAKDIVHVLAATGDKLADEGKELFQAGEQVLEGLAGELAPSLKDLTDDLHSVATYIGEALGRDLTEAYTELTKGAKQIITHLSNVLDQLAKGGDALAKFIADDLAALSDAGVQVFTVLYDGSKEVFKQISVDLEPLVRRLQLVGADVEDLLLGLGQTGHDAVEGK